MPLLRLLSFGVCGACWYNGTLVHYHVWCVWSTVQRLCEIKFLNVAWDLIGSLELYMCIKLLNMHSVCLSVWGGNNPLISIRRSQRHANADFGHRSQDSPGAKAALIHSCGASTVGLKQTGSAHKYKGVTWIHWNLSQVFRFALFINLSVSLHTGTFTAAGRAIIQAGMCYIFDSSKQ